MHETHDRRGEQCIFLEKYAFLFNIDYDMLAYQNFIFKANG